MVNRGFLYGPFCPIYGVGALLVVYLLQYFPQSTIAIFLGGAVVTSALEYLTSFLMEKLFATSWWDYSDKKFNLNGRICLLNSTLFGLMCVVINFDVHPVVEGWIVPLNEYFKLGFLCAFGLYFAADCGVTLYSLLGINARLRKLAALHRQMVEKYGLLDLLPDVKENMEQLQAKIQELDIKDELSETLEKLQKRTNHFERRLISAFPQMESRKYPEQFHVWQEKLQEKRQQRQKKSRK